VARRVSSRNILPRRYLLLPCFFFDTTLIITVPSTNPPGKNDQPLRCSGDTGIGTPRGRAGEGGTVPGPRRTCPMPAFTGASCAGFLATVSWIFFYFDLFYYYSRNESGQTFFLNLILFSRVNLFGATYKRVTLIRLV
jgi:hypothetical protein